MPAKRRSFVAVVKAAERSLRAARVDHVFVGALAVAAFGVPRTTTDLEVIVDYHGGDAPRLVESFRRQSLQVSVEDLRDARAEGAHCTVHDTLSAFRVDIAPAVRARAKDAIRHSVRVRWRGSILPIADPAHTIVMKLVYGSDQDVEDALGIFVRQRKRLKMRRMRDFASRQGVLQVLRELEGRAGNQTSGAEGDPFARRDLHLSLIGVPTNSAGKRTGVAKAPAALRSVGLTRALRRSCHLRDEGDVSFSGPTMERDPEAGIIGYRSLVSMVHGVRKSVRRTIQGGRFPLVIGGDCPVLLGCLAASVEAQPMGLVFVDGHEDAYPAHKSPTGEAADMELGFALGLGVPELIREATGPVPLVDRSQVCILGPRDKEVLKKANIRSLDDGKTRFHDADALRTGNIETLVRKEMRQLTHKVKNLWLHVDLDVLSTRSLPAVDYPQPGGLSWIQLEKLTTTVLSSRNVVGMSVTIYNPDLDPGRRFARRIVRYLKTVLTSVR